MNAGANSSSTTDFEQLSYDAGSNVTSRRLRDAQNIGFTYDNLNRPTLKNLPGTEPDVTYGYDNLSRMISASQTGNALSFTYDALSRNLTQVGPQGTVSSQWDIAGRRTRLTYPGSGLYVDYDYLVTGETSKIRENGATGGVGVLATYGYDDLGRRTSLTFGNGASQAYGFDPVSRLNALTNELTGSANDLSATFSYTPASQIASTVRTGDAYAWTGHFNTNVTGTANGLNQLTSVGPKSLTHDSNGNITVFGTKSYTYSSENLLLTGPGSTTLGYDPAMRLYQSVSGATIVRYAYDGVDRIAEYDGSNSLRRRYVHGDSIDEPLVWYEGSGTTDRRFLGSDERGSIISLTDSSGAVLGLNKYDEYGNPGAGNIGAFGYTGQLWLTGVNSWYYKARVYDPELGRFLQSDPIGFDGGLNLYSYVGNNAVNLTDPTGTRDCGLESNWRSGDCAASSVFDQLRRLGADAGWSDSFVSSLKGGALSYARGEISFEQFASEIVAGGVARGYVRPGSVHLDMRVIVVSATIWTSRPRLQFFSGTQTSPPVQFASEQKVRGPWKYGNFCGTGGAGEPTNQIDRACRAHDQCYANNGLGAGSNLSPFPNAALRQCNQALCDDVKGTGSIGFQIRTFFKYMPMPYNACRWDR